VRNFSTVGIEITPSTNTTTETSRSPGAMKSKTSIGAQSATATSTSTTTSAELSARSSASPGSPYAGSQDSTDQRIPDGAAVVMPRPW
jgi:hypothetical protein